MSALSTLAAEISSTRGSMVYTPESNLVPPASLGALESLGARIAAIHGGFRRPLRKTVLVMAGDHGVTREAVSTYPTDMTRRVVLNMLQGRAAINAVARSVGARVEVVDMGMEAALETTGDGTVPFRIHRLGAGTRNIVDGPAMDRASAMAGIDAGILVATEIAASGCTLLGVGEMGIGNTTSASALAAALLDADPAAVTARGTTHQPSRHQRKIATVRAALARYRQRNSEDVVDILAGLGGYELVGLVGAILGAAQARLPVLLDTFTTHVAALAACRLCPAVVDFLFLTHRPVEPGDHLIQPLLGDAALLDLDISLGEGCCAALAMQLAEAALGLMGEAGT
jgi:nicotinate-nucleotide--dimethylbenzimidazole phosphoribosyltransferase